MPLLLGDELGAERIQRDTLIILIGQLNAQLALEDAKWATLDQQLAAAVGIDYVQCISNQIQQPNYFPGHHPSLIESPVINYPNISAISGQVIPSADQGDHYEGLSVSLGIEAMCIDGPYNQQDVGFNRTGEDLVNRKCKRMAEAIHSVMMNNRTLGGIVEEINTVPRVLFSDVDRRRDNTSFGSDYYWQMVRLDYSIQKVAAY